MRATVATADGVATVDLEEEELVGLDEDATLELPDVPVGLPLVVTADSSGPLIVAVVARRPPLVISRDAGSTWREAGNGLPAGRAVAISPEHPDVILFASRNRLYLSRDGGRFWHPLAIELDDIRAVAWADDTGIGAGEPTIDP